MRKFLAKKGFGPIILFVYVVALSMFLAYKTTPALKELLPVVTQEAAAFLPITFQNGEIVEPVDAVISKTYSDKGKTFTVTLDTRTEKLDLNALPGEGIYLSRKCVYMVSNDETKVRCFSPAQTQEPIVITKEVVEKLADGLSRYVGSFLTVFFVIMLFIGFYLIILFYTIIMHWIVKLLTKTTFGQTLFVNTLAYIGCNLVEIFTPLSISFWIKIVLFVLINFVICRSANREEFE